MRTEFHHLCLLIFTLLISGLISAQNDPVVLSAQQPEQQINEAEFLADPNLEWTIQDILAADSADIFQPYGPDNAGYSDTVRNYWVRFSLHNTDSFDREWLLNFDDWSYVTLHRVDDDGRIYTRETGHLMSYLQRHYPFANDNNILIHLEERATETYYVLLQSRPDHIIRPSDLGFKVSLRSVQDRNDSRHKQIISIFIGIYAMMFLYNLFVFISIRDVAYVYYLIYILGATYMTLNNAGFSVSIVGSVFEDFPLWRGTVESIVSAMNSAVAILFTMAFLRTKKNLPFWHKILRYALLLIVIMLIGANVNFEAFAPLIYLSAILIIILFVIVGVRGIRKKVPSAQYYLLAYIFSIAGTMTLALALLGVLPLNDFTFNYSSPTGYTLQLLFFSFALADKINVLKTANEEKQARIIEHLRENEQLQTKVTRELEEKVTVRTHEIVKQKEIIQEEKEKSEKLLYNILPQTVARELIDTGSTKPARFDEVSVLFTDFVDFTHISASIPPDKLVHELNEIFFMFDDIVEDTGLEKIKTIGDSYMAVSGLPIKREDHAVRCVRAAMEMIACVVKRNKESAIKWDLRIGIHTGPVVAGVVGKKKFTFDLWGDTVNMASRMESAGVPGKVNVSAYTFDLIRNAYKCTYRGKVSIKGKGDIDMYLVDEPVE